jgi:hypothetical protein
MLGPRTCLLLGALALLGCEGVPDIRFVGDASASLTDSGGDGPRTEAGEASVEDAGPQCTGTQPNGSVCCGGVWCLGDCTEPNCGRCANQCGPAVLCCGKNNLVQCKSTCP